MTSIAVSSRNMPMTTKLAIIRMITAQGLRSSLSRNRYSSAFTAPNPSKTVPKANAARISHMNMQETLSVLIDVSRISRQVKRPLTTAARSEEHTSELQSLAYLVCRLLLEKKNTTSDHLRFL